MSAHVTERLSAYLDGELLDDERRAVDAHVRRCEECARHLEDLAAVDELARALPVEAPAGYFESLPGRVRFKVASSRKPAFRLPAWSWAVAAAALLAVVAPRVIDRKPAPGAVSEIPPFPPPAVAPPDLPSPPASATPATTPAAGADAARDDSRMAENAGASAPEGAKAEEASRAKREFAAPPATPAPELRAPGSLDTEAARQAQARPEAPPAPPAPLAAKPAPAGGRAPVPEASGRLEDAPDASASRRRDEAGARGNRAAPAEAESVPADKLARAPGTLAKERYAPPPDEGPAGQNLPDASPEKDAGEAQSEGFEAKKQDSAGAARSMSIGDADAVEKRHRSLGYRSLLALSPQDAGEARRARERWRAFLKESPTPSQADEARVRVVEMGAKAWRFSNDPVDLALLRQDAEAYLRREDAAQGSRVRALLKTIGN